MHELITELLADSRVASAADLRNAHARRARVAQSNYKNYSRLLVIAGALATIAGALILLSFGTAPTDELQGQEKTLARLQELLSLDWLRTILFCIEVGSLAGAAFALEMLRSTRAGAEWLSERQAAEEGRVTLFETIRTVAQLRDEESTDPAEAHEWERAAFEHFVEEQLKNQLMFHERSDQKHSKAAGLSAFFGAIVAAVIAAAGATGIGGHLWIVFAAFVGVVAPVILNALRQWQDRTLDQEKTQAYRKTWSALKSLAGDVDAARRALAENNPHIARDLITKVHKVMRAENEVWRPNKVEVST